MYAGLSFSELVLYCIMLYQLTDDGHPSKMYNNV